MRRPSPAGFLVTCVTLTACAPRAGGSQAPARSATAAPEPARKTGPKVLLPSGLAISLEVARTDEERAQGLMFRSSLPKTAGMVFLFDSLEARPFWMKNCHFPLDIVHTLADGTVVEVLRNVPPCKAEPCPSYAPKARSDTVVELNAGVADANAVAPGARLTFRDVPGR